MMTLPEQTTPPELTRLINQASISPFATDLLEVDEALWGGFWQGDVIAPGYSLPAVELALLRATRLDKTWPEETTVIEFVADLHTAIRHPQTGVWTLRAAGEACVVFAAPLNVQGSTLERSTLNAATVVWYCETTGHLHAGYRGAVDSLNFPGAAELRRLDLPGAMPRKSSQPPVWLEESAEQHNENLSGQRSMVGDHSLGARLDTEILYFRYHSAQSQH